MSRLFTSESVTEGHPDKVCDQISDAVVDEAIKQDKYSRVACETAVNTGFALVMGEMTTKAYIDVRSIVRDVVTDVGYIGSEMGFDANTCGVIVSIDEQSADIALGVDNALESKEGGEHEVGAGDQGMMFGFACNQTETLMPAPIYYAGNLAKRLSDVRKQRMVDFLRPDGKTQVTVEYDGYKPVRIDTVVVSTQHNPDVDNKTLRDAVMDTVILPTLPKELLKDTKYYINPTGRFVIGGPYGDSGLTGRKLIVDTYGGYARHGGGAFSGKDPTKVDRSATYMLRYVAKNIVAAGLADECELQVSYAIGVARPIGVYANTFGTGKVSDERLTQIINAHFDLRPQAIIDGLDLRRPIYRQVSTYGHFGRNDLDLPWEKLDKVSELKAEL